MAEKLGDLVLLGAGESFQNELLNMVLNAMLFDDFTSQELKFLAKYMQAYGAVTGTMIFKEGGKGSFLCIIAEGKVDILKTGSAASPGLKKIATITAGKTLGEMSVIDGMPFSATAVAADPTKLVIITRTNFERIAEEQPRLAYKMLHKIALQMSQRLRRTTGQLVDFLET